MALYNRAGRQTVRAGRSALGNRPSWNTDLAVCYALETGPYETTILYNFLDLISSFCSDINVVNLFTSSVLFLCGLMG